MSHNVNGMELFPDVKLKPLSQYFFVRSSDDFLLNNGDERVRIASGFTIIKNKNN